MEELPCVESNTSGDHEAWDLASMIILGMEKEVVEYLDSTNRFKLYLQSGLSTCLELSIEHKRPGITKRLIEAGATIEAEHIPLVFKSGDAEIVDIFLSHHKDYRYIDTSCATLLVDAALEGGNLQFLHRTLSKLQELNIRMDRNLQFLFPLHEIVKVSHLRGLNTSDHTSRTEEALGVFIQHGVEINGRDCRPGYKCETPLQLAARLGNVAGVKALLKFGADIFVTYSHGEYPWMTAWNCEHYDTAQELLEEINVAKHGNILLQQACRSMAGTGTENHSLLITALYRYDTRLIQQPPLEENVNRGAALRTALKHKVDGKEIASLLLQAGASVNLPDHNGHTLLMDTSIFENRKSRDWLLQNGADVNAVAVDGLSVLWTAVSQGPINPGVIPVYPGYIHVNVAWCRFQHRLQETYAEDLLLRNIDMRVSQYKHQGMTPLLSAYKRHQHEACNLLLDADCSLRGMSDYLNSTLEQQLNSDMQRVRTRILEMCDEPYSLQAQARLAVLRTIGQCDLIETLHLIYRSGLLPKAQVNYLGKSIKFNVENCRE